MPGKNDSLLWNDQMRKVYAALLPITLGAVGVGAATRAFSGVRDGSFAFGNVRQNLDLLADGSPYLNTVGDSISLPSKQKQPKAKKTEEEAEKGAEFKLAIINLDNLANPIKTFFRGSANPTGSESAYDIPAAMPLSILAGLGGLSAGSEMMGARMKVRANNKIKEERERVKREFEAALIYEQEEAARRNKKASEQCDLVQAIDELYTAAARYDALHKTASLDKTMIGLAGLFALFAGRYGYQSAYAATSDKIKQKEKEKLLGLDPGYDNTLKNLQSENVGKNPPTVGPR